MIWVSRPPRPPCRHGLLAAAPCMAPEHPTDPNRFLTSFPSRPRGLDPSHFLLVSISIPDPPPSLSFLPPRIVLSQPLAGLLHYSRRPHTCAWLCRHLSHTFGNAPIAILWTSMLPTRHIESCAGRLLSIGGGGSWSFSVPKKYPRFRYVCPTMVLSLWPVGIRGTQQIWEMRVLCAWKSVVSVL